MLQKQNTFSQQCWYNDVASAGRYCLSCWVYKPHLQGSSSILLEWQTTVAKFRKGNWPAFNFASVCLLKSSFCRGGVLGLVGITVLFSFLVCFGKLKRRWARKGGFFYACISPSGVGSKLWSLCLPFWDWGPERGGAGRNSFLSGWGVCFSQQIVALSFWILILLLPDSTDHSKLNRLWITENTNTAHKLAWRFPCVLFLYRKADGKSVGAWGYKHQVLLSDRVFFFFYPSSVRCLVFREYPAICKPWEAHCWFWIGYQIEFVVEEADVSSYPVGSRACYGMSFEPVILLWH